MKPVKNKDMLSDILFSDIQANGDLMMSLISPEEYISRAIYPIILLHIDQERSGYQDRLSDMYYGYLRSGVAFRLFHLQEEMYKILRRTCGNFTLSIRHLKVHPRSIPPSEPVDECWITISNQKHGRADFYSEVSICISNKGLLKIIDKIIEVYHYSWDYFLRNHPDFDLNNFPRPDLNTATLLQAARIDFNAGQGFRMEVEKKQADMERFDVPWDRPRD